MGKLNRKRLSVQEPEGYASTANQTTKASASQDDGSGDGANIPAVVEAANSSRIPAGRHPSR